MKGCGTACSFLTVNTKSAVDISKITFYGNEKESLLAPGTQLKVVSSSRKGKVAEITLEEDVRIDGEKVTAFQGFVNMVNANPQVALRHPVEFAGAIASLCPPPPQLHQPLQQILTSFLS
eukprot:symbB.v1.2.001264.t1/scaffold65.1/size366479/11